MRKSILFIMIALTLVASRAHATSITWTVQNVVFDDQTTLTGSFSYDAINNIYQTFSFDVQAGGIFTAYHYTNSGPDLVLIGNHSDLMVDFVAFPPSFPTGRYIHLSFTSPLTSAGGTVSLQLDGPSWECNNCGTRRLIESGFVTAPTAVPEPATLTLVGLGLAAVGARRRRRASAARAAQFPLGR